MKGAWDVSFFGKLIFFFFPANVFLSTHGKMSHERAPRRLLYHTKWRKTGGGVRDSREQRRACLLRQRKKEPWRLMQNCFSKYHFCLFRWFYSSSSTGCCFGYVPSWCTVQTMKFLCTFLIDLYITCNISAIMESFS